MENIKNIIINQAVVDEYKFKGKTLEDAIATVYKNELKERREADPRVKNLKNIEIAMLDAGINRRTATVGDIIKFNAAFTTQGNGADSILFPVWTDSRVREAIEKMDIMKYAVASQNIVVDGGVTKGFSLNPFSEGNKKGLRKARVAEGADIPTSKIKGEEVTVTLHKIASAVEMTYEAVRRMKIPLYEKTLDFLARDVVQGEIDMVVDTLINGSGNDDKAKSLFTTQTENVITNDELSQAVFMYYMDNKIAPTTLIVGADMGRQIAGLTFKNDVAFGANSKVRIAVPQLGDIQLTVLIADVPKQASKNVAILYNNTQTIDKYVESGSMISETQSNIVSQKNIATASENVGFAIFLKGSNVLITSK